MPVRGGRWRLPAGLGSQIPRLRRLIRLAAQQGWTGPGAISAQQPVGPQPAEDRGPAAALASESPSGTAAAEQLWTNRTLIIAFLMIRGVHLLQGYIDVGTGFRAYQLPLVAVLVAAGCTIDSLYVLLRSWRRGRIDPFAVGVDAVFGAAALLAIGVALADGDRTTSLNWLLPYTVGTTIAAGIALRLRTGLAVSTALGALYVVSVWPNIRLGQGPATTAIVNAVSYLGFFGVVVVLRIALFALLGLLDRARHEAVRRGQQLAAERERARQRRLMHDSALQLLEAVAKGWGDGNDVLRQQAREEAHHLRMALRDDTAPAGRSQPRPAASTGVTAGDAGSGNDQEDRSPAGGGRSLGGLDREDDLGDLFRRLAAEFASRGLHVEFVDAELDRSPGGSVARTLRDAAREALTNVAKHAGVETVVVRAASVDNGVQVTVRDRGCGFSAEDTPAGFGTTNSIRGRMTEIGGRADIASVPGRGTRVDLWSAA